MLFRRIDINKDKETLIRFRKDTQSQSVGTDLDFDEISYMNRMAERVTTFPEGQLLIERNNTVIGQIGMLIQNYENTNIGYINLLYLTPEYRSQGIGKDLIHYAENFFRDYDVSEFHLRVSSTNDRAIQFYLKVGMEKLKEEHNEKTPSWRMRKMII